jgi:predicted deacylase
MTASEHGSSPSASRCSEDAIFDALAYLVDIVGDLHETGKTSETRLRLLHESVWELHAIVKAQRSARSAAEPSSNGEGVTS